MIMVIMIIVKIIKVIAMTVMMIIVIMMMVITMIFISMTIDYGYNDCCYNKLILKLNKFILSNTLKIITNSYLQYSR